MRDNLLFPYCAAALPDPETAATRALAEEALIARRIDSHRRRERRRQRLLLLAWITGRRVRRRAAAVPACAAECG